MGELNRTRPRRRWSLARRLAVLMFVVLMTVVSMFGAAAYNEVRTTTIERATDRLTTVTREAAVSATRGLTVRLAFSMQTAASPIVRQALQVDRPDVRPDGDRPPISVPGGISTATAALRTGAVLDSFFMTRRRPVDTTLLSRELWTARGERVYQTATLEGDDSVTLAATMLAALRTDTGAVSRLYAVGQELRMWTVVPVHEGRTITGALAERFRVTGNNQTEATIARLTGQNARVYFTSSGSPLWGAASGTPVTPPITQTIADQITDTTATRVLSTTGTPLYVAAASVRGTPLRIVLTQSEASILERPRAMRLRFVGIAIVLLLLGTIGTWWVSRRETQPLARLQDAADAMARGDYTQVVTPRGAAETAALMDAFNAMVARIHEAHVALADQNRALHQANEAKARFLAVMSHELRTPLNAIAGHAELMALGVHGETTAAQEEALARIQRNKDQLLHLVNDVLHFARLDARPLAVQRDVVALQEQFVALHENMRDEFARKGVALLVTPTDSMLLADRVRLMQVLNNLVVNALQFTDAGGEVQVSAHAEGAQVRIRVRDTGIGIAPDQVAAIFEPFVQADTSLTRRTGGTGLGLAIVRQLTVAMGGEVTVDSVVGAGTTFTVTLPAADAHALAAAAADSADLDSPAGRRALV
jgi:signal transduction histidine kinase